MVKKLGNLLVLAALLFLTGTFGATPAKAVSISDFSIETAKRSDWLRWNIAGNMRGDNPNILSELTWTGIETWPLIVNLQIELSPGLFLRGTGDFAFVYNGTVQDSDYTGNNRSDEFSRSVSDNRGDYLSDMKIAAGYRIFRQDAFQLSGIIGYGRQNQYLRMTNGYQIIPDGGPFPGLNSTYRAVWVGPFIGTSVQYTTPFFLRFTGSLEYHLTDYTGRGDWNLRDDLAHPVSFQHRAGGAGSVVSLGMEYNMGDQWSIRFTVQKSSWSTGPGTDQANISGGFTTYTRLNEAVWNNLTFVCLVGHLF